MVEAAPAGILNEFLCARDDTSEMCGWGGNWNILKGVLEVGFGDHFWQNVYLSEVVAWKHIRLKKNTHVSIP